MNTEDIMKISLDLVEMTEIPADSAIYVSGSDIKRILYGIDIGVAELQYAKENNYDAVVAHHPVGLVNHYKVFWQHLKQLKSKNIPGEEARAVIEEKLIGFKFGAHARNYDSIPAFARLIKMPFLNIHCPSDELGRQIITQAIEELCKKASYPTLDDVIIHLESSIPEFSKAQTRIEIAKGSSSDQLGNWIFSHGAFTNGGFTIANLYYKYGLDTVIYIHITPADLFQILSIQKGQLLITGHLVSDSIGINPLLNELENRGIEITVLGGLLR
ncbi:MAG: hypothetical protein EAX86_06225 [Candidatus Heimdallarchaeota archaeon]|nr:hypothetical protein [Candidatus Heimdallarchaeota archaeon]